MVRIRNVLKITQWLFSIIVFLSMNIPAYALADLELSVSRNQVELGKPVELRLYSPQIAVSLHNIDLTEIRKNFHIKHISDIQLENNSQTQHVTLYPRSIGTITIPSLHFINTRTREKKINITPALDPKDNSELEIQYTVSTLSPWQKQQVLVEMQLTSQASILVLQVPRAYSDHSEILTLKQSSKLTRNNSGLTSHVAGWSVFPRQEGVQRLELPGIQLVRDGVVTHRFYPPFIELNVKPLPVYIPATMPVGKLNLVVTRKPRKLNLTDSIDNTEVMLTASDALPSTLPSIANQFKSNADTSFYPATIKQDIHTNEQGVYTEYRYSVSYKTLQQGFHSLSDISLNYFDPDSGTIRSLRKNIGNTFSLHISLVIAISVLTIISVYVVISKGIRILFQKINGFLLYKNVLDSIPDLKTGTDIRLALDKIARAEHWHHNLSLQQWHQHWLENRQHPCPLKINILEAMLYAGKDSDIEQLKRGIQQICFSRWSLLKFISA